MVSRAHQYRLQRREQIRSNMQLGAALKLEEMVMTRGIMPKADEHGNLTGEFDEVEVKERLAMTRHYIDKALPNNNPEQLGHEAIPAKDAEVLMHDDEAMSQMSDTELRELAQLPDRPDIDTENPWA